MRYVRIAGEIGPKGEAGLLGIISRTKGIRLGQQDTTPIDGEALRTACMAEGLTLFTTNPNPQALSAISAYCGRIGLTTRSADTSKLLVKDCRLAVKGLRFIAGDPEGLVEKAMGRVVRKQTAKTPAKCFFLPDLANPATYLALGTVENIATAIKMATHAKDTIEAENTRRRTAMETSLKKATPAELDAVEQFISNLAARRKEDFQSFREEASQHGEANIKR